MSEKKQKRQRREQQQQQLQQQQERERQGFEEGMESDDENMTSRFENHNISDDHSHLNVSSEYVPNFHEIKRYKEHKKIKKLHKKFTLELFETAQIIGWEDHELAKLFHLLSETNQLNSKQHLKLVKKLKNLNTEFFACLSDHNIIINSQDFLQILHSKSRNIHELMSLLDQNLEQNVIDVTDMSFIQFIQNLIQQEDYTSKQMIQLLRILCTHSNSLKVCGQILNYFYQDVETAVACKQMSEILNHSYIYELEGTITDFLSEFHEITGPMEEMLSSLFRLDDFGKIIPFQESDEDEDGNLIGFIENEEDEAEEDEEDEEEEEEYQVAHSDSMTSSTESDGNEESIQSDSEGFNDFEHDEDEGEDLDDDEDEESDEEAEFEDIEEDKPRKTSSNSSSRSKKEEYQITPPSKQHKMKQKQQHKKKGVFHEKKMKTTHNFNENSGNEVNIETIRVDTFIPDIGIVSFEEEEESTPQQSEPTHQKEKKKQEKRKKKPKSQTGKRNRVIVQDSSGEEEEF